MRIVKQKEKTLRTATQIAFHRRSIRRIIVLMRNNTLNDAIMLMLPRVQTRRRPDAGPIARHPPVSHQQDYFVMLSSSIKLNREERTT